MKKPFEGIIKYRVVADNGRGRIVLAQCAWETDADYIARMMARRSGPFNVCKFFVQMATDWKNKRPIKWEDFGKAYSDYVEPND